jgi:hypothetical protein
MAIAAVIVCLFFFMSLGGDNSANDETQNMGQAHHATTAIDIPGGAGDTSGGPMTGGYNGGAPATGGYNGGNEDGAKAVEELVDEAVEDIQHAEEEQLEQSEGMLSSALSSIGNVSSVIHSSCVDGVGDSFCFSKVDSNIRYYLFAFSVYPYWYGQDARK